MMQLIDSSYNSVTVTVPKETTSDNTDQKFMFKPCVVVDKNPSITLSLNIQETTSNNTDQTLLSKINTLFDNNISLTLRLDALYFIMCMREKFIKKGKIIDEEFRLVSEVQKKYSLLVKKSPKSSDDPNIDILKIDPQYLDRHILKACEQLITQIGTDVSSGKSYSNGFWSMMSVLYFYQKFFVKFYEISTEQNIPKDTELLIGLFDPLSFVNIFIIIGCIFLQGYKNLHFYVISNQVSEFIDLIKDKVDPENNTEPDIERRNKYCLFSWQLINFIKGLQYCGCDVKITMMPPSNVPKMDIFIGNDDQSEGVPSSFMKSAVKYTRQDGIIYANGIYIEDPVIRFNIYQNKEEQPKSIYAHKGSLLYTSLKITADVTACFIKTYYIKIIGYSSLAYIGYKAITYFL